MWINKLVYFAVLLYAGVLSLLYTRVQCFYVFLILLIFGALQVMVVSILKNNVSVRLLAGTDIVSVNEPIQCGVEITNRSFLPLACTKIVVSYENSCESIMQYQTFNMSINARSVQSINFKLTSEHVGTVKIGIKKIRVYDFLRIFHRKIKNSSFAKVTIFPEICTMESDISIAQNDLIDSEVYSKIKSGDDPSEVFDIREYKDGDKIHRIHWKLSSKRDCVMVKEYSLPIACSAGIIVNLSKAQEGQNGLQYYDSLMSTILSVSYHLLLNEQMHYIAWYEQGTQNYYCITVNQLEDVYGAINQLLDAQIEAGYNEILATHLMLNKNKEAGRIYYVTPNDDDQDKVLLESEYSNREVRIIRIVEDVQMESHESGITYQYVGINHYKESIETLLL